MWDDLIELGIAAFVGMQSEGADAVEERLRSLGLTPALARHLAVWLPEAFAARVLSHVSLDDAYGVAGGGGGLLSREPIFQAARERALRASREEALAIAPISSLHAAAARAERDGGDAARGRAALALVDPLPWIDAKRDAVPEPRAVFRELLVSHGVHVLAEGMSIDALVFPTVTRDRFQLQVDFVVCDPRLAAGRVVESFAGIGATYPRALANALEKFERGTLHVLVATLFDHEACADQVSWETWSHRDGELDVCLGPQILPLGSGPSLGPALDPLIDHLALTPLTRGLHSLRLFTMREGERTVVDEVLLDGEPWEAGRTALAAAPIPRAEPMWSARLFAMLDKS
ncbi:MAG: DUF6348 family protein [Sandaracinus sp.]